MARKLGKIQREMLGCLERHGKFCGAYSGWVWDSQRKTQQRMERLTELGFVTTTECPPGAVDYVLTDAGRAELKKGKDAAGSPSG